jgi:small-conductance mechanosensitive channel
MHKAAQVVLAVTVIWTSPALWGQDKTASVPVQIAGETLFVLHSGVGSFSAEERGQAVTRRLHSIMQSAPDRIEPTIQKSDLGLIIVVGREQVIAVTDADARAEGVSLEVLTERWSSAIRAGLLRGSAEKNRETLPWRIVIVVGVIVVSAILLSLLNRARRRIRHWLSEHQDQIPTLHFRGLELISVNRVYRSADHLVSFGCFGIILLIILAAFLLIFGQFPATRSYAYQVFLWLWEPLRDIGRGVLSYLPNLFYILVIAAVTRVVLRGINFIFEQAHRGAISLEPWIHSDVARPTSQIIKAVLVIMALFFVAPLIPGTGSTAARGISVILGLMVSFGSTSTVGNLIAGIVLTYMRPFQLGDRVKIGDTSGDVIEKTFLYTKILTIKNEEVIVPSLQALGGSMVNYSAKAAERRLILHTSVTIGYDAPWRKVHELLIRAAERTGDICRDPKPFVLQTSLDDFFVSYQINAYTGLPNRMATIYSELHQNIQDSFNEEGVEIMSPHQFQHRDGNRTAIPDGYLPADYKPPRFLVDAAATISGK